MNLRRARGGRGRCELAAWAAGGGVPQPGDRSAPLLLPTSAAKVVLLAPHQHSPAPLSTPAPRTLAQRRPAGDGRLLLQPWAAREWQAGRAAWSLAAAAGRRRVRRRPPRRQPARALPLPCRRSGQPAVQQAGSAPELPDDVLLKILGELELTERWAPCMLITTCVHAHRRLLRCSSCRLRGASLVCWRWHALCHSPELIGRLQLSLVLSPFRHHTGRRFKRLVHAQRRCTLWLQRHGAAVHSLNLHPSVCGQQDERSSIGRLAQQLPVELLNTLASHAQLQHLRVSRIMYPSPSIDRMLQPTLEAVSVLTSLMSLELGAADHGALPLGGLTSLQRLTLRGLLPWHLPAALQQLPALLQTLDITPAVFRILEEGASSFKLDIPVSAASTCQCMHLRVNVVRSVDPLCLRLTVRRAAVAAAAGSTPPAAEQFDAALPWQAHLGVQHCGCPLIFAQRDAGGLRRWVGHGSPAESRILAAAAATCADEVNLGVIARLAACSHAATAGPLPGNAVAAHSADRAAPIKGRP